MTSAPSKIIRMTVFLSNPELELTLALPSFFRYRVIAAFIPWMTSQNPFDCQDNTPARPVLYKGFFGIMRAGGVEAALVADKRRQRVPVNFYQ
jgi:hypothetical protein